MSSLYKTRKNSRAYWALRRLLTAKWWINQAYNLGRKVLPAPIKCWIKQVIFKQAPTAIPISSTITTPTSTKEQAIAEEYPVNVYGKRIPWEIPVQLCIKDFLREGDCAFDIGANIGGLSVAMSRIVGPSGQVHAFEANPFLLSRLKRDLETNEATNVILVPKAVWSKTGELLPFYLDSSYYTSASSLIRGCAGWKEIIVETITLDDYCFERQVVPQVIKIDVEGAEFSVLIGAERILKRYAPVIVFEYRPSAVGTDDPAEYLRSLGYTLYDTNLYREVDRKFYLSSFQSPPLVNILAISSSLLTSSLYSFISIIPVRTIDVATGRLQSDPLRLECPGRYMVSVDFDGPDSVVAGLKVTSAEGENLAYFEAAVHHLKQHSCSNLIFEIDTPTQIKCEIVAAAKEAEIILLRRIGVARIEKKPS